MKAGAAPTGADPSGADPSGAAPSGATPSLPARPPLRIKVPATAANLGPGFDSVGLALSFGLTVEVYPLAGTPAGSAGGGGASPGAPRWQVELPDPAPGEADLSGLPTDETNLIVRTALAVAAGQVTAGSGTAGHGVAGGAALPPCRLVVRSQIPLARGLGSSASAIVAGTLVANELGGLGLAPGDLVTVTARLEGHPDNVAPAILGGLVIAAQGGESGDGHTVGGGPAAPVTFVRAHLPPADIVLCIPDYPLPTVTARAVLPATLPFADAVLGSARANVLVAALLFGDWPAAGRMLGGDLFHEPFRQPLLPDCTRLREVALAAGAYGAALSGAGPTVIAFAPPGRGPAVADAFRAVFPRFETRVVAEQRRGATVVGWGDRGQRGS
jgi:homoserine kinase